MRSDADPENILRGYYSVGVAHRWSCDSFSCLALLVPRSGGVDGTCRAARVPTTYPAVHHVKDGARTNVIHCCTSRLQIHDGGVNRCDQPSSCRPLAVSRIMLSGRHLLSTMPLGYLNPPRSRAWAPSVAQSYHSQAESHAPDRV